MPVTFQSIITKYSLSLIIWPFLCVGLYLTTFYSYILFHIAAESFSIVIAISLFVTAWNTRHWTKNNYVLFICIAFLFVGLIDFVHTLAYKGMGIFIGYDANLPTQLWIIARYLQSISLLIAPRFIDRKLNIPAALCVYLSVTLLLLAAVFSDTLFPDCFIEGAGLTPFKIASEYIICFILICSFFLLYRRREKFDPKILRLIAWSILCTIVSELAFTFYISVYGLSNMIGHFFKIFSFYLIYKAVIVTGLKNPYSYIFYDLQKQKEELQAHQYELEMQGVDLQRSENQLKLALQAAEAANRAKSAFLANMSHEIRTPLSGVFGMTGLLFETPLTDRQRRYVEKIKASGESLLTIINDIMDYTRIEARKLTLESTPFSMEEVIGGVVKIFRPRAAEAGIDLHTDIDPKLPAALWGDPRHLTQVISNLMDNAVKFTAAGDIQLAARVRGRTSAAVGPEIVELEISVRDTGIGMTGEELSLVFTAFRQADVSATRRFGGIGLGLAISRQLVELMGGTIQAESTPGKGSIFTVVLSFPVAPDVKGVDLFTKPDTIPIPLADAPAKPECPPWNTAELRPLLTRLQRALARREPRPCMEILEALLQRPCPEGQDAVLAEVNRLVQRYRLAEALALHEKEFRDTMGKTEEEI